MEWWTSLFNSVQQWLFESVIQPVMFHLGMASLLEDGYDATGWLLVGLLQVLVIVVVIGPLERWRPVEAVTDELRRLMDDMLAAMYAAPGIGLAAPQVGEMLRLVVIDLQKEEQRDR